MQQATQGSNGATPASTPVSSLPKKLPTPPPLIPPNMPGPDDEDDISPNTPRNKIAAFNTKQKGTKAPPKLNEPGNPNYQPIEPAQDLIPQDITTRVKKTANDTFGTGALFLVFSVLAFLIWTLIPTASGYTRMQLLYFTILKKTNCIFF